MVISVLTPTERAIMGLKKGESGVFVIPDATVKQLREYRSPTKTNITTPSKQNDTVTQTITTERRSADWLDVVGSFFPPAQLFNIGRDPVGTERPVFTTTGTPEALAEFQGLTGGIPSTDTGDTLSGALEGLGSLMKYAVPLVGIGLILSVFGKVKRLF